MKKMKLWELEVNYSQGYSGSWEQWAVHYSLQWPTRRLWKTNHAARKLYNTPFSSSKTQNKWQI